MDTSYGIPCAQEMSIKGIYLESPCLDSPVLLPDNGFGSLCYNVNNYCFCSSNPKFPSSIDNSEWTRNGDYLPANRLEATKEAANFLASRKLASNVENCVAIMTMGGQV